MFRAFLLRLLAFYQRYISVFSFGSCRYYPSCSSYAKINFEKNSISRAFYYSFVRILRCNGLFDGGIDYPLLDKLSLKPAKLDVDTIRYWLVPDKKSRFYIIKNFSFKGKSCLTK